MSRLKIMMIVSSLNKSKSQYFPKDSPEELINEIAEVSNRMRTVLYKGIIETNINKFTYQHYTFEQNNEEEEEKEKKDYPIIFICSDKSCKDSKIENVFKEIFECLKKANQIDSKISNETKRDIAKIFLKYKNIETPKETNDKETEFGIFEENTGLNMTCESSTFFDISESINLNDSKKRYMLRNMEKKKRDEIENIKRWKKIKIFYLIISIILLLVAIASIPFAWKWAQNENR